MNKLNGNFFLKIIHLYIHSQAEKHRINEYIYIYTRASVAGIENSFIHYIYTGVDAEFLEPRAKEEKNQKVILSYPRSVFNKLLTTLRFKSI